VGSYLGILFAKVGPLNVELAQLAVLGVLGVDGEGLDLAGAAGGWLDSVTEGIGRPLRGLGAVTVAVSVSIAVVVCVALLAATAGQ
jgi:hypothetical protein